MKKISYLTLIFLFALSGQVYSQTVSGTLFKDAVGTGDWSIGGTSEHLEIREPEQGNMLWARFVDGNRLELLGTPNLLANGHIEAKGNLIAGLNREIRIGTSSGNHVKMVAASCCPGAYIDYNGGPLVFRRSGISWHSPLTLQANGTVIINANAKYDGSNVNINGHKLAVNGGILCEEIEVINDVPHSDYVFEKDYPLLPLEDLEKYLEENKHLPEVPSAKDFKENGYKLGEMDDLLLRKVEELTLYVIQQQKELKTQQEKLEAQQEKLEAQQAELMQLQLDQQKK